MTRNDIHSPSNFKPQDYTVVDYFGYIMVPNMDQRDGEGPMIQEPYGEGAMAYYESEDRSGNPHRDLNQCDLCGQRFVHGAVLEHKDGDVITVGGICMAGIAGVPALTEGQKLFRVKKQQREAQRVADIRRTLAENPGINRALKADHYITRDLRAKLIQWGSLSEKQVALAFKLEKDIANRPPELTPVPVPESDGRFKIQGTILSTKEVEGYAYGTTTTKCLIQVPCDGGAFKVWGTLPQAATDAQWEHERTHGEWPDIKGAQITFTARFERSKDDEAFGFYKRPTKVSVEFPKPERTPCAPTDREPAETSTAAF